MGRRRIARIFFHHGPAPKRNQFAATAFPCIVPTSCGGVRHVAERWDYPIPQALQRHTGCRFVPPARRPLPEPVSPSPSTAPDPADPADAADPLRQKAETGTPD
jgi:hypothetical protein